MTGRAGSVGAGRGFLLVAVGERQNRAASVAIGALRARGNALPVALVTDGTGQGSGADIVERIEAEPYGCRNVPAFLPRSPFAETVFLAHDMVAFGQLDPVFDLLAVYDIAAAHAADHTGLADPAVPEAFYPFDAAVIAYRSTPAVLACLAAWHERLVDAMEQDPDDPLHHAGHASLRRVLWQHRLAVAVLPPEYNYRAELAGFLRGKAALVHAAGLPAGDIARTLNRSDGPRVFAPFGGAAVAANPWAGFATAGGSFAFGRLG